MIRLVDVSKVVSSGTERLTIVDEVTLEIPRGEFVSVIGPSGSGKSTLLSLIAGLDSPTSGEIFLDDRDITKMSEDDLAELRGRENRIHLSVLSPDSIADCFREYSGSDGDYGIGEPAKPGVEAA